MSADSIETVLDRIYIHDVDSHVSEPPDLWTSRVSSKWGDDIPHVVADHETGVESWYIGGHKTSDAAAMAPAGWREPAPGHPPTLADALPAAWQPGPRLQWMDDQGVYSQVIYPNILGFIHPAFFTLDAQLQVECVQAYNDFQTDFCSENPDRLIAMTYLPWWDIEASQVELQRCQDGHHKGVILPWEFERHGLPPFRSDHWEPLLKEIEESGLPISFHIGFDASLEEFEARIEQGSIMDIVGDASKALLGNARCIVELITGGTCHRYPNLKFVSVESGMGYIPYLLEGLDWHFMNTAAYRAHPERLLPSEYFRRQMYGTFWFESDVARLVDLYPDNFMFETDFPHGTGLCPGPNTVTTKSAQETIHDNLGNLSEDLLTKLLQDNAAKLYGLPRRGRTERV